MTNKILDAREKRATDIKALDSPDSLTICVKANIPGEDKNLYESHLLVRLFTLYLKKRYIFKSFTINQSDDGPYALLKINRDHGITMKQEMILIEDTHPLGRFIDLDVFYEKNQSISRKSLHLPNRKCYLCGKDAHVCSRSKSHSTISLIDYIQLQVKLYLKEQMKDDIHQAIVKELELEDKFGLVTKNTQGSHQDMDYQLMIHAEQAILPFFVDLFFLGYETQEIKSLLKIARPLGIKAEEQMLLATGGINAYKGLIYILGITLLSLGYTLKHHLEFDSLFKQIKIMTRTIYDEFEQSPSTAGIALYKKHQITGIRGESHRGMPSVQSAFALLDNESDLTLRRVLKHLILVSEDTVFLKRAKTIENYHHIKQILNQTDISDPIQLQKFNLKSIKENLSFGGSADLLIVTIFLKRVQSKYFD